LALIFFLNIKKSYSYKIFIFLKSKNLHKDIIYNYNIFFSSKSLKYSYKNKMPQHAPELFLIMGTRPEIIKFAPIISELYNQNINFEVIYTNQHYNSNLSKNIFDDLELSKPKFNFNT